MIKFDVTYFHGPFAEYLVKDEIIADIAASGITLVPLNSTTEVNLKALPILAKYGLNALVGDPRIYEIYDADDVAGADETVRKIVGDYAGFGNVVGFDIVDEPAKKKFPVLAAIVRAFRRYAPDKETIINLFPDYVDLPDIGCPSYDDYLENFVNTVNPHCLSYDHYSFLGRESRKAIDCEELDAKERMIRLCAEKTANRSGFFENISSIRAKGLKYDLDCMLIVLLTEHGPYRNLTYGELLWEVNMSLAYGMKRISYFTYWEPEHSDYWHWTNAMCDTEGKKMQHWYDVQSINQKISDAGTWLFGKKSTAVFHIGTPDRGGIAFENYGRIKNIRGENGVIGFFDDGSAYLVNKDYVKSNTFVLEGDNDILVRVNAAFVNNSDNKKVLTVNLDPGEGLLIKTIV